MFRFNEHDGRLDRTLQCILLLILSCLNPAVKLLLSQKLILEIYSHSGDGPLRFWCSFPPNKSDPGRVKGRFPTNQEEALKLVAGMYNSCLQCVAGDNTITALELGLKAAQSPESPHSLDESFVIVTSDALLGQYGIKASEMGRVLMTAKSSPSVKNRVKAIMIFMGSIQNEAAELKAQLPPDSCYLCLGGGGGGPGSSDQQQDLVAIIKSILSKSVLVNPEM